MFIMLCFDLLVSNYLEALWGIIKLSRDLLTQTQLNDRVIKNHFSFRTLGASKNQSGLNWLMAMAYLFKNNRDFINKSFVNEKQLK